MKATLGILFVLCAGAAFGQTTAGSSVLSAQPAPIQMSSHPQHASYMALGQERSLTETSTFTFAHGERPLWEVAPVKTEVPLGDVARALREEHLKARRAEFVREN